VVGGSKKHGGPDLGPTRTKAEWRHLGVNAAELSDRPPDPDFEGDLDRPWAENIITAAAAVLTVAMVSSVAVLMYLA